MPRIDIVKEIKVSKSGRARQLEGLFDVPRVEMSKVEWHGNLPIEQDPWSIGLIVGPSGCGKSSILEQIFSKPIDLQWTQPSVIDDFAKDKKMTEIGDVCRSVGFNTIPSWLRPFAVLSNGERFRVDLARRLIEQDQVIVDEFTSVVDRQVAQIASHAVQKYIRKHNKRFVAASCHYDIIDWLQPDWVFEPSTMKFQRRSLQRRPSLEIAISRVPFEAWQLFAPFHYLTADLHRSARCFAAFVNGRIAAFAGVLYRPVSHASARGSARIYGVSRLVTLPDWQGMGIGPFMTDVLGSAYKAIGGRLNTYPAHPALIRSFAMSKNWRMYKEPGASGENNRNSVAVGTFVGNFGNRPCAKFEYVGAAMSDKDKAQKLIEEKN